MIIFQLSVSYRDTDDINRFPFPTYAAAVRYAHQLEEFWELLNGYTIRRLVAKDNDHGFVPNKILKHVCWHLPKNVKQSYKKRYTKIKSF